MPLQVGDKVRVVKFEDPEHYWPNMIDRTGEILGFEENDFSHYVEVEIDDLYGLMFSPDELEVVTK